MSVLIKKLMRTVLQAGCGIVSLITVAHADDQPLQQASIGFIKTYFEQWSSANRAALAYLNDVFPDHVMYFDKTIDHVALMSVKRDFALRWPERRFVERSDSVNVACDSQRSCAVWGLVDWECRNQQRHAYITGTSVFSLQLEDGMKLVAEDGFTVSRGQMLAPQPLEVAVKPAVPAPPAPEAVASQPPAPAARAVAPTFGSRTGTYGNDDIPALRAAYFARSADRNWISAWLTVERTFTGSARLLGPQGIGIFRDTNGDDVHVLRFATDKGPIACMVSDRFSTMAEGSDVRIKGVVSIFIDQTLYLADCSFS